MRAQSTCFVQEGDLPIDIFWEKDGRRIDSSRTIKISQIDPYTSMITISKANAQHSGNYTCVAKNAAKTVTSSALFLVNGEH